MPMENYLDEIDARFALRNTPAQKEAFRAYAGRRMLEAGFAVRDETQDGSVNLVIGDAESAAVVFTAHYDTPRRALIPNVMLPLNPWLRALCLLAPLLLMLAAAIAAAFCARVGFRALRGRRDDYCIWGFTPWSISRCSCLCTGEARTDTTGTTIPPAPRPS